MNFTAEEMHNLIIDLKSESDELKEELRADYGRIEDLKLFSEDLGLTAEEEKELIFLTSEIVTHEREIANNKILIQSAENFIELYF